MANKPKEAARVSILKTVRATQLFVLVYKLVFKPPACCPPDDLIILLPNSRLFDSKIKTSLSNILTCNYNQ